MNSKTSLMWFSFVFFVLQVPSIAAFTVKAMRKTGEINLNGSNQPHMPTTLETARQQWSRLCDSNGPISKPEKILRTLLSWALLIG